MKILLRKITASTDVVADRITEIQDSSNNLVDAIIVLMNNLPSIQQTIAEYDAKNAQYDESLSEELPEKLDWIIKQLKDVIHDVNDVSDYFLH